VRGFVKVTRDLTSRRAAEEERERLLAAERQTHACAEESWGQEHRARTEAEAALAARDQVMAELAHDLQQPLTAIRLGTQVIERFLGRLDQESEESAIRAAAILKRTVERMARWVADLRDVAQLRAGQELPLDRRPTDLVALARRLVEEHQRATERHRIRLVARPTTLVGTWDEARLERVLDNLLGNAVKFSPDGGDIEVEVEEDQPSGWALLRVRDAGLGIPSAELPRLFEMFHRASNVSDRVQGSGLGLASARAIVERHGGTVLVESREGVGSTFTMKLPLDEPSVGHRSGVGSGEAGVPAERSDKSARG
jgi:signal transduction histidine kinase